MGAFDPDALECLAAVVEEGSFERAAQRQLISQSAVSQRLMGLEAQIGVALVVRSRPVKLATAGQLLLKHVKQLRVLRADFGRDLRTLVPGSTRRAFDDERISIAVNADCLATWVLPALRELAHHGHPLEIIADDHTLTHQWLREGLVQGCVTTQAQGLKGCKVVAVGQMDYVAVAQRAYTGRHCPRGLGMDNFREIPFVAFNRKDDTQAQFVAAALGLPQVRLNQLFVPSAEGRLEAVLDGWGAGVFPRLLVQGMLREGRLCDIAPGTSRAVPMYWHCWTLESEVLDHLTAALVRAAQNHMSVEPLAA
ncbi:LysR family transcriptional regulator ArgP [Simplicispira suum]|uniref:ArgP/LysG family DNA-binding transcriptional regulator n=1 Tax=Simplicispira suum TaxID=2109915 RepID=A0A2S0MVS6_9BURK|nr:LysR family transcriptional regulator ArgP [Simplicispira suum]AVO39999.1 ArgP/LysG family DNA-binding transcriptional regulator [Simplicispira suum]